MRVGAEAPVGERRVLDRAPDGRIEPASEVGLKLAEFAPQPLNPVQKS